MYGATLVGTCSVTTSEQAFHVVPHEHRFTWQVVDEKAHLISKILHMEGV